MNNFGIEALKININHYAFEASFFTFNLKYSEILFLN